MYASCVYLHGVSAGQSTVLLKVCTVLKRLTCINKPESTLVFQGDFIVSTNRAQQLLAILITILRKQNASKCTYHWHLALIAFFALALLAVIVPLPLNLLQITLAIRLNVARLLAVIPEYKICLVGNITLAFLESSSLLVLLVGASRSS